MFIPSSSPILGAKRKVALIISVVALTSLGGISAASAVADEPSSPVTAPTSTTVPADVVNPRKPDFAGTKAGGSEGAGKAFGQSHKKTDVPRAGGKKTATTMPPVEVSILPVP